MKSGKLPTGAEILAVVNRHIADPMKQARAVGELIALVNGRRRVDPAKLRDLLRSDRYNLRIAGKRYSADEIKRTCKGFNPSLYLFSVEAFYQGVGLIDT